MQVRAHEPRSRYRPQIKPGGGVGKQRLSAITPVPLALDAGYILPAEVTYDTSYR